MRTCLGILLAVGLRLFLLFDNNHPPIRLAVLRMYHQLGVRYMTLTHSCNNAFADSAGIFGDVKERWGGLSPLGRELIPEMNRLGIFIDLSHVSDQTALQALNLTEAPVILSHSCARHFNKMNRNVPDNVLDRLGREKGKVDGVVMVKYVLQLFRVPAQLELTLNAVASSPYSPLPTRT